MTKDQQGMVLDLLKLEGGLSDWEMSFIENLHDSFWIRKLTESQDEKLRDIVEKRL